MATAASGITQMAGRRLERRADARAGTIKLSVSLIAGFRLCGVSATIHVPGCLLLTMSRQQGSLFRFSLHHHGLRAADAMQKRHDCAAR